MWTSTLCDAEASALRMSAGGFRSFRLLGLLRGVCLGDSLGEERSADSRVVLGDILGDTFGEARSADSRVIETVELCEVPRLAEAFDALSPLVESDFACCSNVPLPEALSRFVTRCAGKRAAERWARGAAVSNSK